MEEESKIQESIGIKDESIKFVGTNKKVKKIS
jgi:predicted amidohydrolase YtcJ